MSSHDDDIEFDFFDEPETREAASGRRRLPSLPGGRGDGPRRPRRPPTGLVPLARLAGLVAIAIVLVVGLVSWIGACQGKSKHDEYASYMAKVQTVAAGDNRLGREFAAKLTSALKQDDLENSLQQYAQQEQQAYDEAQQIRAPGPLRALHQNLVDALELRAKGLAGLADALVRTAKKDSTAATAALTTQAALLTASDIVWDQLYRQPATLELKNRGVTGVVVPESHFVSSADFVSARAFTLVYQHLHGASTGGTASGKHGDQLVKVRVIPQGVDLSTSQPTTVNVSPGLAFQVTIENSGDFQEVDVPVTLTIDTGGGKPIKCQKKVLVIQPTQTQTVTCGNLDLPATAFGPNVTVTAFVAPVNNEINTANNKATYSVFFNLSK